MGLGGLPVEQDLNGQIIDIHRDDCLSVWTERVLRRSVIQGRYQESCKSGYCTSSGPHNCE